MTCIFCKVDCSHYFSEMSEIEIKAIRSFINYLAKNLTALSFETGEHLQKQHKKVDNE